MTPPARRAAKPKAKAEPVVFRGPPDRLASLIPLAEEAPAEEAEPAYESASDEPPEQPTS